MRTDDRRISIPLALVLAVGLVYVLLMDAPGVVKVAMVPYFVIGLAAIVATLARRAELSRDFRRAQLWSLALGLIVVVITAVIQFQRDTG